MKDLASDLEQIRKKTRVPALAAAAYINGELQAIGAVGVRKIGSKDLVTIQDKWHVGSCTKPMTSTLAGILIDQGCLDWSTTISDVFESRFHEMHSGWHHVTLEHLLSHHGGAPTMPPAALWQSACERAGTPTEQRTEFVRGILLQSPASVPGSKYQYSNAGYAIAGLMLETCATRDWESLIKALVFQPLGMDSVGFGTPGASDSIDQPYGHARLDRKLKPVEGGSPADGPAAIGPSATVNCSIHDLLLFAACHAGGCPLLCNNTRQRLYRRYGASEYSSGWFVLERNWGNGYVLRHYGANCGWLASMWVAPFIKVAFVAASNSHSGQPACDAIINRMIEQFLR